MKPGTPIGSISILLHEKVSADLKGENVYPLTEIIKKKKDNPIKVSILFIF